ncbi:hypothetical protein BBP40_007885 [Aspergillus hancockii]|nr:hypothetical protein BBP40_007885 [Aspergillus hancockii]
MPCDAPSSRCWACFYGHEEGAFQVSRYPSRSWIKIWLPILDFLLTPTVQYLYKSDNDQENDKLCQLPIRCELHFFHIEIPAWIERLTGPPAKLLSYLRQQQNLQTLALLISVEAPR